MPGQTRPSFVQFLLRRNVAVTHVCVIDQHSNGYGNQQRSGIRARVCVVGFDLRLVESATVDQLDNRPTMY